MSTLSIVMIAVSVVLAVLLVDVNRVEAVHTHMHHNGYYVRYHGGSHPQYSFVAAHKADWTWHNASLECLKQFSDDHGHAVVKWGGPMCEIPHRHSQRVEYGERMMFKWFCVRQCMTEFQKHGQRIDCKFGIGDHTAGEPTMRCKCYRGRTATFTLQAVHDKWMAECVGGGVAETTTAGQATAATTLAA